MGEPITHNSFRVTANPTTGVMTISLVKDGVGVSSVDIDTKEASRLAAVLLGGSSRMPRSERKTKSAFEQG